MGLAEQAIQDMADITSNSDDFGVSITLTSPSSQVATLFGYSTKHHLGLDAEGQVVRTKTASVAIAEGNVPFSIRNVNDEVDLNGYLVDVLDSTGIVKNYKASNWFPDEKLGLIVIILQDYDNA